jgi:hypothetical protein
VLIACPQVVEGALCLVFMEHQSADLLAVSLACLLNLTLTLTLRAACRAHHLPAGGMKMRCA